MNGLYISNVLNGFLCAAVIAAGAWIGKKRFPRTLEDQIRYPDNGTETEDPSMRNAIQIPAGKDPDQRIHTRNISD